MENQKTEILALKNIMKINVAAGIEKPKSIEKRNKKKQNKQRER